MDRNITAAASVVQPDSYLTLHYRLSLTDGQADVVNTFGSNPATLQLGVGQMAEPLERRLLGLEEGAHRVFELEPGEAFGPRNPELIQRVANSLLARHGQADASYEPGDLVEFPAPDGQHFAGVVKEV
ncbi:MAG: FKBP-type peptidyl-prolyl cis-trans isomerase, partial [Quisquiliibacterium sp.]